MAFYRLEKLINLYDGYRQIFSIGQQDILLIQENNQRYAIQASCPHLQWPLQNASMQGRSIVCTKHGWGFDAVTGRPTNSQAMECQLIVYKIAYEENIIGVYI